MSTGNTQLRQIAGAEPAKKPSNFPAMLDAYKGEIARALPRHLNADRLCRIALTCFRMTPKLAECEPASVFAAVVQAAQLGLEPGLLGQAYLIPYKDKCQLIPGYQGLLELVRRSGMVEELAIYVVHERDEFSVQFGSSPKVEHVPYLDGDPGAAKLAYGVAKLKGGGQHIEVMTKAQIERIRDRSTNVINAKKYSKETPWDTDADEMWRKTVARRICKYLPKSPELAMALTLDDTAGRQDLNVGDAIAGVFQASAIEGEVTSETVDEGTGEIIPPEGTSAGLARAVSDIKSAIERATSVDQVQLQQDMARNVKDDRLRLELETAAKDKLRELGETAGA